jgi:hypothetical protein
MIYYYRIKLIAHVRSIGQDLSSEERMSLAHHRDRIQARIDAFDRKANELISEIKNIEISDEIPQGSVDEWDRAFSEEQVKSKTQDLKIHSSDEETILPECSTLLLPSSIGLASCDSHGLSELVHQELQLRIGQANECLHQLQMH